MKVIKADLSNTDNIQIELFSDLHIGSTKCDYKQIQERVNRVRDNPNVYAILLGDLINNSTKTSCGDCYSEPLTPTQQIAQIVSIFEPIKDKILCVTSGNHERRTYRQDGIDLLYLFCAEMGIQSKYDYVAPLLILRFGTREHSTRTQVYTIYCTHGDGAGGRLVGSKANALSRRGNIVNADIIIQGHTHQSLTFREMRYEIDTRNNKVVEKEQVFVNTASTLNYEEYAEIVGFKPSNNISPVIELNSTKHDIKVFM